MFVIPKAWTTHATLLQQVLLEDIQSSPHKPTSFPNVGSVLESHYNMIQARVRVFTHLNSTGTEPKIKTRIGGNVEVSHFAEQILLYAVVSEILFSFRKMVH